MDRQERSKEAMKIIAEFTDGKELFQNTNDVCAWAKNFAPEKQAERQYTQGKTSVIVQVCRIDDNGSYRSDAQDKYHIIAHGSNAQIDFRCMRTASRVHRTNGARSISLLTKLCVLLCQVKDVSERAKRILCAADASIDEISKYPATHRQACWDDTIQTFIEWTCERRQMKSQWAQSRKLQ